MFHTEAKSLKQKQKKKRAQSQKSIKNLEKESAQLKKQMRRRTDRMQKIESDTMNDLLSFLKGEFTPDTVKIVDKSKLPKLTTIQAWFVIYVLQEHFEILPEKFEMCDDCGRIFDSEIEGIHTDDKVQFEEGEIGDGLPLEDIGKFLCGQCEDVHRIREYAKDEDEDE